MCFRPLLTRIISYLKTIKKERRKQIMSFRPLLTRIISYRGANEFSCSRTLKTFPSPFNEDHFISRSNASSIITLKMFPSPFNEDHFISYAASKRRYIRHTSYFCLPNIWTRQLSDKSILSNFRTFQTLT